VVQLKEIHARENSGDEKVRNVIDISFLKKYNLLSYIYISLLAYWLFKLI
jgi:hypothetical protein